MYALRVYMHQFAVRPTESAVHQSADLWYLGLEWVIGLS